MLSIIEKLLSLLNPANNAYFVGKQLKKPNGFFASKVAKGMNVSNKNLYDLVFQNLDLKNNENVLEVGFGNGFFFKQINQKNQSANFFGVEISKEMIRQCIRLNNELIINKTLEVTHFSGVILPYEKEFFDKLIAVNLIYFWENPTENIKELHRVLKPNGELFIGIRPFEVLKELPFTKETFNLQQDSWWITLFETYGFQLNKNQIIEELPLQFNGKTYEMAGICLLFKKIS